MSFYLLTIFSIDRKKIFESHCDYQRCLKQLEYYTNVSGIDIKAFCLMPDHLKLIVRREGFDSHSGITLLEHEAGHSLFDAISVCLSGSSALMGQLICVDRNRNLNVMIEYIENEPVRLGIVLKARDYTFSSASHILRTVSEKKTHLQDYLGIKELKRNLLKRFAMMFYQGQF
jgi:REP element-mobilizing transposase RayT